jgi:hypothetical protein
MKTDVGVTIGDATVTIPCGCGDYTVHVKADNPPESLDVVCPECGNHFGYGDAADKPCPCDHAHGDIDRSEITDLPQWATEVVLELDKHANIAEELNQKGQWRAFRQAIFIIQDYYQPATDRPDLSEVDNNTQR